MKKILSLMICIVLVVGIISFVSAMSPESYNKLSFFDKLKYGIQSGSLFGLFTTWGQANGCSEQPDKDTYLWPGDRIDCDDYCGYDKCAIDVWYDNINYLYKPTSPNWNNLKYYTEKSGEGAYFKAPSTHQIWVVEVYCCPKVVPDTDDHSTKAYVCEKGSWDYKSRYDKDEYCRWDTSGVDLCWCSDEEDRFYVDESDGVHCRSTYRSSWCTSCTSHASKKCYSNDIYYYDSCGKRETKYKDCGTPGCTTGSSSCKTSSTECTSGQYKCTGSATVSKCVNGKWQVSFDCMYIFGYGCVVGTVSSNSDSLCILTGVCDGDGNCDSGETVSNCPSDCCALGDTTCSGKDYHVCEGGEWTNKGKVNGKCGYTDSTGLGTWNYCSSTNKCGEGEGDCDWIGTDKQCQSGLICVQNVGAKYGFSSGTDVCEKSEITTCTSHASKKCYSNDIYYYDSCGKRETKYKDCGTPGCTTGSSSCKAALTCNKEGYSCGGPSHLQSGQSCCVGLDCQNFQCVKTGTCTSGQTRCGTVGDPDTSGDVYYTCVGGTFKSQGKVVGKCGYSECQSGADSDGNGQVNRNEVGSHINKWLGGQVTRTELGQAIQEWSSGC